MREESILDLIDDVNDRVERIVQGMDRARGYDQLGLDPRAGRVYIDRDCIVSSDTRSLEYYGGFEYVDSEYVMQLGDYKVYLADADRVQSCIEKYFEWKTSRQESPTEA